MPNAYIDQKAIKTQLAKFFNTEKSRLSLFGSRVNQTFEAFVFASVIKFYQNKGWTVRFIHPQKRKSAIKGPRLKFSTRGRPDGYSYVICKKGRKIIQVRHQLRVCTSRHSEKNKHPANVCLDVAVIEPTDLSEYKTYHAVPNNNLITFAESKHMSAFAELVASFIGMVHELQPFRLKRIRTKKWTPDDHPAPLLYVSGSLYSTAEGLKETINKRKYDIDIFSNVDQLSLKFK